MIAGLARGEQGRLDHVCPQEACQQLWPFVGGLTAALLLSPEAQEACGLEEGAHLFPSGRLGENTGLQNAPIPLPSVLTPVPLPLWRRWG